MSAQTKAGAPRRGPMGGHGGHGPGGMMPGEKAKDLKGTLKKLVGFMGRFKVGIAVVLVFAVASTVFTTVGPKVMGQATTELFNGIVAKIGGTGDINFDLIAQILLFTMGLYL
ncbi:MAG: ABC transporter ATP-binding protein, partial [Gordonibacter sp.]